MSRAALAGIVGAFALAVLVAVIALGGGGGGDNEASAGSGGRLAWVAKPRIYTPETLPRDRILVGDLRNDTLKEIDVRAAEDVKLLDADGRGVEHSAIFTEGFGRDIYPPSYRRKVPLQDQLRLGLRAKIKPGETAPVTVAWRVPRGAPDAVTLRLPGGDLEVPSPD